MEASGAMAANKWVGDYYLTGSGAMAKNTWIGNYYVGADGKWIPGYKK
jgi:glucan-binding YG repeat protein